MTVSPNTIFAWFRFLAWLFPATPLEQVTALTFEELRCKYRRRDFWGNILGFLTFLVLAVVCYYVMVGAATIQERGIKDARYIIGPSHIEFAVWAGAMSLTGSMFLVLAVLRAYLGEEEFAVYSAYGSCRVSHLAALDIPKVYRMFFWLFFLPLLIIAILRVDTYTAFTNAKLIDNSTWSFGSKTEHPYSAVRGVYEVRGFHARFKDLLEPYQVITFSDGSRWQTDYKAGGPKLEQQREIVRFVAERSGKTIRRVNFIEDIPPH
jgi:hypothetical protein